MIFINLQTGERKIVNSHNFAVNNRNQINSFNNRDGDICFLALRLYKYINREPSKTKKYRRSEAETQKLELMLKNYLKEVKRLSYNDILENTYGSQLIRLKLI
jgi:hypothetical protein